MFSIWIKVKHFKKSFGFRYHVRLGSIFDFEVSIHNQNLIDIRDEKQQKHTHTDGMKNNIAVIDSTVSKLMIMNQYFFLQWIYTVYIYDKPSACLITSSTNVSISSNSFQRKKISLETEYYPSLLFTGIPWKVFIQVELSLFTSFTRSDGAGKVTACTRYIF